MENTHNSLLVADDNEMNREMLCRRLEKQGYTVASVCDGQEALELMAVENFDLLLLDIMMPILDGYSVLERMNNDPRLKLIPVIVLTAENDTSNIIRCIELGANDYLVKPFDMVALRNRIVRCLLHKRVREDVAGELNWEGEGVPDILIVEDDEMSRELLEKRVARSGYHVSVVSDGEAAIKAVNERHVDLVLLDIMMPGMSGFDVLEAIKQNNGLSNVQVIMISALDDNESIEKCMQMGAEDYITKPFNALILKSRILSCIRSKRIQDVG
ncbi:MAG TPA: response regulator [Gammaproteobacteria bacterium]|mgnify:CR=1 FL=1|nr:response regulator [Gammaproteobacteria bacterium]